jgi:hypothetical protein
MHDLAFMDDLEFFFVKFSIEYIKLLFILLFKSIFKNN